MFFKSQKRRKEITLSNSTIVALRISNKILKYIFRNEKFQLIHASLEFCNSTNKMQPWTKEYRLEVLFKVLIGYSGGNINLNFKFPIQSDKNNGWEIVPFSNIWVNSQEFEIEFWLSCSENGKLVWNNFDITLEEMRKSLADVALYFKNSK